MKIRFAIHLLPIMIAFILELALYSDLSRIGNFVENTVLYALLLLAIPCIKNNTWKIVIFTCGYVFLTVSLWFETVFYYLFLSSFSASAVYILIETNSNEASEFLNTFVDFNIILFSALFFVLATITYYFLVKYRKQLLFFNLSYKFNKILLFGTACIVSFAFLKFTKLILHSLPYLIIKTTLYYSEIQEEFELSYASNNTAFPSACRENSSESPETFVFVIGESTTKNKMQLYGYKKPTNPKLAEIKNDLLLFQNVISPHTYTVESLNKALTTSNYENNKPDLNRNLVELFNTVDFKTFWISNQRPVGIYENLVTKIASCADEKTFISVTGFDEKTPFDLDLIPHVETALKDPREKKAIFIHLMGAHIGYELRYPKDFTYFKPKDENDKKEVVINEYDNAIRYNDTVVYEIIQLVKKMDISSFVLYFSDHGEEVYDNSNTVGHYEGSATKSMYEIPFILWFSDKHKNSVKVDSYNLQNKFMTDDLIHAISDLCQIEFDGFEEKRSIFNPKFNVRPRIIQRNINFDTLFYEKGSQKR